jgi:glyoxalase/bleomycin resistance protein/dioxygenase superfamily protein
MKPRFSVLTLGVADLDRSLAFYRDWVSLGHNVGAKREVDAVIDQAGRVGGTVLKEAADTFYGGYAGYFQDPDQFLWEVVWNPAFVPADGEAS